ncbi:uncharacterized protein A4U43_C10F17420 [Asparagus officinalis]|uniref:Uncharacterized protein n=1 Tax=Asparagus officinalis TaxID=4686 RepID=A0A5P1E3Q5_ASPOF|nr:uncharacterized protein A4U43_C10F17420 [Asparagus officinalis]
MSTPFSYSDSGSSLGSESNAKAAAPIKSVKELIDNYTTLVWSLYPMKKTIEREKMQQLRGKLPLVTFIGRLYLYRSCFADTFLKDHENTLNQGEKKDPEILQRRREELERQQREGMRQYEFFALHGPFSSRFYADSSAASRSQSFRGCLRKAEAKAAADAKRKREAARQALLQANGENSGDQRKQPILEISLVHVHDAEEGEIV